MSTVSLRDVRKSYGAVEVIHGIDLDIQSGEFVVFVGPSGCGKSTLLRMIAGLESITDGEISIDGKVVNELASSKRGISMVFQSYALYPHMTVFQNMAFGLELAKTSKSEIEEQVLSAARILQIEPLLDRMPKALSGGQRQRVAIGRAIVRDPAVFLFDEPLSNLDAALRTQTRVELAELHQKLGTTMVYVTHDQTEAMTLADRIVVLNAGRVEQSGPPLELYQTPQNAFVAGFIANQRMNFLPVDELRNGGSSALRLRSGGTIALDAPPARIPATVGMRPEDLRIVPGDQGAISGTISIVEHLGEYALVHLDIGQGQTVTVKVDGAPDLAAGEEISVSPLVPCLHLFDSAGKRIAL